MNAQTAFGIYTIRVDGKAHSSWVQYGNAETVASLLKTAGVDSKIEQAPAYDLEEWVASQIADAMRDC